MPTIQPISDELATKVVRIIYRHLGPVHYRDSTKTSKRIKWELDRPLPQSARDEISALGVDLIQTKSPTHWRPAAVAIHVNKSFSVKDAVKDIPKPVKPLTPVQEHTNKEKILAKLKPYISGDDINLSLIELIQVMHDRIKEDLS